MHDARATSFSRFRLCFAQVCSATSRALVHSSVYDEFSARLAAAASAIVCSDPLEETTQMGPLISAAQRDRVSPPLACIFGMFRLYLYPACISPYPWYPVYPCVDSISIHFAADPLYPTVSDCI